MSGPAGDLGRLNALLNPTEKLAGPTNEYVGRAAEEVNHQNPIFLHFPWCVPYPSSALTSDRGLLLAAPARLLCCVTMTHVVAKAT